MVWQVVAIIISVISVGVSYHQAKKAQEEAEKQRQKAASILLNREGTSEQLPVIYGTRRAGGIRVFARSSNGPADIPNDKLLVAMAICEGEVDNISDIHINGEPLIGGKYAQFVNYWIHTGSPTQAADATLIAKSDGDWTANHKLSGIAYIVLEMRMPADVDKNPWSGGLPEVTALVRGKKVYDPRTGQTAWSDNPALCIRDYLTNSIYGKGLPASAINDTAFTAAANKLDETEVLIDGEAADKPFRCNAALDTSEKLIDNLRELLLGCRGFLPYSSGQYALTLDVSGTSVMSFGIDDIVSGINVEGSDKSSRFNQIVLSFPNPQMDYQIDEIVYPEVGSAEDIAYLQEDGDERLSDDVELTTITSRAAAYNLAKTLLIRSRSNTKIGFNCLPKAMNLLVGDVISVTHPSLGWVDRAFKVEEVSMLSDGTCDVAAREFDPAAYNFDSIENDPSFPPSTLPDPFTCQPPTNLQLAEVNEIANDGSLSLSLDVSWTAAQDGFVSRYELQWKKSTDTNYNSVTLEGVKFTITGVSTGNDYDIRVRAINSFGTKSDWLASTSDLLIGDETAPAAPSPVNSYGGLREITITWSKPTDSDFSYVEVWENLADDSSTATKVGNAAGTRFTRTGLDYGVQRYYWLKSVDYSGNISGFSASTNATTLFVDSDAFTQNVLDLIDAAGNVKPVASLPASGIDGEIVFLTTTNALYRWDTTTSAWVPAVDAEVSIENGTITGNKIVANTITGGLLATAGIITNSAQIDNLIVTGAKIADAAITTAKIGDAEVETLKIAGQAVSIQEYSSVIGDISVGTSEVIVIADSITITDSVATSGILISAPLVVEVSTNVQLGEPNVGYGTAFATFTFYLYRGSTLIETQTVYAQGGSEGGGTAYGTASLTFTYFDQPPDGTHTYTIKATRSGGTTGNTSGLSSEVSHRHMILSGAKR